MSSLDALFLDAAGTLIEPAEPVAAVYARAAAAEGLELSASALKQAFHQVFSGLPDPDWAAFPVGESDHPGDAAERHWWQDVVARTLKAAAGRELPTELCQRCFEVLFAHYEDPAAWLVFPEVAEVLAAARERGWKIAVVSNFDRRLHRILAGHGLEFDAVITSADARARKPDPAIFRLAMERTGCTDPGRILHAGDSRSFDFEGAAALGLRAYLVERPANDLRGLFAIAEGAL